MRRDILIWSIALGLLFACTSTPKQEIAKKKVSRPKVKVNLPPKPNLDIKHPPELYTDGSYSVEGFFNNFNKLRNKKVKLTGYVKALHLCPEGEDVECHVESYAVLADFPNGPSMKVMIFAKDEAGIALLRGITKGQKVTLEGIATMSSPKGSLIEPNGLLVLSGGSK